MYSCSIRYFIAVLFVLVFNFTNSAAGKPAFNDSVNATEHL